MHGVELSRGTPYSLRRQFTGAPNESEASDAHAEQRWLSYARSKVLCASLRFRRPGAGAVARAFLSVVPPASCKLERGERRVVLPRFRRSRPLRAVLETRSGFRPDPRLGV